MKILYVEDDPGCAFVMKTLLRRLDIELQIAGSVDTGAQLVWDWNPDLILMDVNLPDGNGYDLTRSLRAGGSSAPVVVVTANVLAGEDLRAREAGCDGFIAKPFTQAEIIEVVERWRNGKNSAR